ncbi:MULTISPECIES: GH92 family glycosyl hydrolase [unclassified Micromonospora]|uniref:GH92 family glycosyl hydrolase n=1 Tax=unclassified Micromonospora TaxID=2617518 RepID=UPI003645EBF2
MTDLSLCDDAGPPQAPAAAAGCGLVSTRCLRYEVGADLTSRIEVDVALPWLGATVASDDELHWYVFPQFDAAATDVRDAFRSAATSIDLIFDDGSRLLDDAAPDPAGVSNQPRCRADVDVPDQWNHRRIPLRRFAGRVAVAARLVVDPPPGTGPAGPVLRGWLDGIAVHRRPAPPDAAAGPSALVDTTRGSQSSPLRSRGNTQPVTGVPHGGVYLAPATDLSNPHWTYSWNAHGPGPGPALVGFLATRAPSIWIGDRGAVAFRLGLLSDQDGLPLPEPFSHDDEEARPYRYAVGTRSGIVARGTATSHAILLEATLPGPGRLHLTGLAAPLRIVEHHQLTDAGDHLLLASSVTPSPHEHDPLRGYAAIRLSGADLEPDPRPDGPLFTVVPRPGASLRIECGLSWLSVEQAEHARQTQVADRPLDALADDARRRWDGLVDLVAAPDADAELTALLASDLYRLSLYPTRHDEDTPDGRRYAHPTRRERADDDRRTGRAVGQGSMLTDNGFWDTYRTCWPAFHLLLPQHAGGLVNGLLEQVRACGWSPRWTAGTPLDAMVGTSLEVITADAVASGIAGIDLPTAYASALRDATAASDDPRFGRRGMPASLRRGFVDATHPESVSWTLEGAICDAGAAVLARAVADQSAGERREQLLAEARYLAVRALAYRSLWDPRSRFFRPRHAHGGWADEPFDPRVWGGGHTETNAWGSRFPATHDGNGLAALFGGPAAFGDALDEYFATPETGRAESAGSYGSVIHEMPEARDVRRGMWGPSNQPGHHVPWMYAYTDRPWRGVEIVTDAVRRLFLGSAIGQGYPGDEDNGEMSAWHLFGVIGLAPFQPGSGQMLIGVPTVDRVRLRPIGAPPVVIHVHDRTPSRPYPRKVMVDGAEWTEASIAVTRLHRGATIDIHCGEKPTAWARPGSRRPFFAPDDDLDRLADLVVGVHGGRAEVHPAGYLMRAGDQLRLDLAAHLPTRQALLTVGLRDPGTHTFTLLRDGLPLRAWVGQEWPWPTQTRPFTVALTGSERTLTLVWDGGPALIEHVQVLGPPAG